ncbi:MAG: hypothetical protein OEV55_10080 [candidate division Zixibacteria bacterium]|nr:hypothetical protein [candidate division Zixibacteria bacterium]
MKANKLIVELVFGGLLFLSINSFAQQIVCIDPGHGGPGATKYCYNRVG